MPNADSQNRSAKRAYIITGPTSGIGRLTALNLANHGAVVLVGRNPSKLAEFQKTIERNRGRAFSILCDLSDISSVRQAAADIVGLNLHIAGLINNAGILQMSPGKNPLGWDLTFATNHLGPFALTEALMSHIADGANIVFVVSAVEDPERKPAVAAGFRGGRYISVEASLRGEWEPGGAKQSGLDAYATSKQAILAAAMALARQNPQLHINAVEPGWNPTTGLGVSDTTPVQRFLIRSSASVLVPLLRPFVKILSTPKQAAALITAIALDSSGKSGVYFDEKGQPMLGSIQSRDPAFQDLVVNQTRAFLSNFK